MLTPSLVAGLFHLSQLRGLASVFCLGLSPLAIEVRLTLGELCSRCRQRRVVPFLFIPDCSSGPRNLVLPGVARPPPLLEPRLECGLALGQPRDVADGRLLLAPSLIAGLFHLPQLCGEATACRLGLS